MIPAFQGFLFGGGVNPFMSRVATYFLREQPGRRTSSG